MRSITASSEARHRTPRPKSYDGWTIEELRAFGAQMQVRDARRKTRRELLELFGASRPCPPAK
jgi:hypothetical protein